MEPRFNYYQYQDLLNREFDVYSSVKCQIIVDYLRSKVEKGSLLNVGCGSGELSFLLAELGFSVLGIDPVGEYVQLAVEWQKEKSDSNCKFQVDSIETFKSDNQFDCLVCTDVLEHIKDDVFAVHKMCRILKKGGFLAITVPAYQFLFGYHDRQLGHWRRYDKKGLKNLLTGAGFEVLQLHYFGSTLLPVAFWYSKLKNVSYPLESIKHSMFRKSLLRKILNIDRKLAFPFGVSLVAFARKA